MPLLAAWFANRKIDQSRLRFLYLHPIKPTLSCLFCPNYPVAATLKQSDFLVARIMPTRKRGDRCRTYDVTYLPGCDAYHLQQEWCNLLAFGGIICMTKKRLSSVDLNWMIIERMKDETGCPRGLAIAIIPDGGSGWRAVVERRSAKLLKAKAARRFAAIEQELQAIYSLKSD